MLQEQRNILALAVGLKGIAAIRAVLNWAPVQAHATSHRVTAYYVTKSPSSAAFLSEWDQWREAGVSACTLFGPLVRTTASILLPITVVVGVSSAEPAMPSCQRRADIGLADVAFLC